MKAKNILISCLLGCCLFATVGCGSTEQAEIEEEKEATQAYKTFEGVIKTSGSFVNDAEVSIYGSDYKVETDANGAYFIQLDEADSNYDSYKIQVKKDGYVTILETLTKNDFTNNKVKKDFELVTTLFSIKGKVTLKGEAVSEVEVSLIGFDDYKAFTDGEGNFVINEISRINEDFFVEFKKEGYVGKQVLVSDLTSTVVDLSEIGIELIEYTVNGTVTNIFGEPIEGAVVNVAGTEFSATTDKDGKYTISEISFVPINYDIEIVKSGYVSETVRCSKNCKRDVELKYVPTQIGHFGKNIGDFTGFFQKTSEGIKWHFDSEKPFVDTNGREKKVQLFFNIGDTETSLTSGNVLEFAMTTVLNPAPIIVIYEHKYSRFADTTQVDWARDITYNFTNSDNHSEIDLYFSYEILKVIAGQNFEMDAETVFGFTIGETDTNTNEFSGWEREDMLGYNKNPYVDPQIVRDYIRVSKEGSLYMHDTNEFIQKGIYKIEGKVTDSNELPIANAKVSIIDPKVVISEVTTDTNGNFVVELKDEYFAISPKLLVEAMGYKSVEINVARSDFNSFVATKTVSLEEVNKLNITGTVSDVNDVVSGVTVNVVISNQVVATAQTGTDGSYSIQYAGYTGEKYGLEFIKTGYTKLDFSELTSSDLTKNVTLTLLGKQGPYMWYGDNANFSNHNTTMWRDETRIGIDIYYNNAFEMTPGKERLMCFCFDFDQETPQKTRQAGKCFEFKFNPDGWHGLVEFKSVSTGAFIDYAQWGQYFSVSLVKDANGKVIEAHFVMKFEYVNTYFGANTFSKTSTLWWTMYQWNDNDPSPYMGMGNWFGGDGSVYANPEDPSVYMGFDSHNNYLGTRN